MAEVVYGLCTLTSVVCALLLLRGYRRTRTALLLWSAACFVGLAVNNCLLFVDLVVLPSVDMSIARAVVSSVSLLILVYGLVENV